MKRPQRGFTLLEVLVAFMVASLVLVVVLSAFASGLSGLSRVDRMGKAALVAQSRIAELSAQESLMPGEWHGVDDYNDSFSWELSVRPLEWEYATLSREQGIPLLYVKATVRWQQAGREQQLSVVTLRQQREVLQ